MKFLSWTLLTFSFFQMTICNLTIWINITYRRVQRKGRATCAQKVVLIIKIHWKSLESPCPWSSQPTFSGISGSTAVNLQLCKNPYFHFAVKCLKVKIEGDVHAKTSQQVADDKFCFHKNFIYFISHMHFFFQSWT